MIRQTTGHTVKPTLLLGFGTLLLILAAIATTGIWQITAINSEMDAILHEHNRQISLMTTMRNVARERSLILQSMLLTEDPFRRDELHMTLQKLSADYLQARATLLTLSLLPAERELLEQQHRISVETSTIQNQIASQLVNGDGQDLRERLVNIALPGQQQAMRLMDQFIEQQQVHSEEMFRDTNRHLDTVIISLLLMLGFGIAVGMAVATFVTRRIQSELSARVQSERNLKKSELRERIIRENILDGIITTDSLGAIQSVNLAVSQIFGHEPDELIGCPIQTLIGDGKEGPALNLFESLFASDDEPLFELSRELPGRRSDGTLLPIEVELTQVRFDGEPHFIVVVRDISTRKAHERLLRQDNEELERKVKARTQELTQEVEERRKVEEKLLHLASHDNLTGLPNRRAFMEQLDLTLRRARRQQTLAAVYFIDLDGFKAVNDNHGHDIGDKLLVDVAQRIRGVIRDSDIASRMGGDEFTLITADLDHPQDAQQIADKLVRILSQPFRCGDTIHHIGASIGISLFPDHGANAEQLIQLADNAMYRVKNGGKRGYLLHGTTAICQPLLAVSAD